MALPDSVPGWMQSLMKNPSPPEQLRGFGGEEEGGWSSESDANAADDDGIEVGPGGIPAKDASEMKWKECPHHFIFRFLRHWHFLFLRGGCTRALIFHSVVSFSVFFPPFFSRRSYMVAASTPKFIRRPHV